MNPAAKPQSDEESRRRIRESIGESLIVEASAGTGKTTELVRRIVSVLKSGVPIDRIAAVTFTNKAAGEMKLRLRTELDGERQHAPVLEDALARLEEASIGTIHSFCAQILHERPVEAGIDPAFEELNEAGSGQIYRRAFRAWLEQRLSESSPSLKRAFARLTWRDSWDDTAPLEQLQWAGRKLIEWRDYRAPWSREPFAREQEIDALIGSVAELAALAEPGNKFPSLNAARTFAGRVERSDGIAPRDYDELESLLLKLGRDLTSASRKSPRLKVQNLIAKRDTLLWRIEEFRKRADADLAAGLRDEMSGLIVEYEDRKQRSGKLDFVDLLSRVRDLVRGRRDVREYLQSRFTHLFIDEFQDTDPLQAELLLLLSADDPAECDWLRVTPQPGKLFLVGDPKQSIYKFRRADMVLYRKVRDGLLQRGVGLARLTKSFRAVPNIQALVNAAFEPEMDGDATAGQADWTPLEPDRPEPAGRPSVIVLPVPRPYGQYNIAKFAIDASLPDAVAAFADWLVNHSNWGFCPRDVAILLRRGKQRRKDLTREYARALEARGIAHLLGASRSFHHREEVETLRCALTAIEWPDDELSVFATLKGSLFAIPDELLLRFHHIFGRLNPVRKLDEAGDPAFAPIAEAFELLRELHRSRNHRSFASTINTLLDATRAYAGFILRPGGQQVLANVNRLVDQARTYEINGGISFRGFVEELHAQAEKEDAAEAPVLEEDSDGVRLLTVHSAKGLEFPVVILADLTANLSSRDPDHVDAARNLFATRLLRCAPRELTEREPEESARERAEGVRVAYVAATRARDLLVIPAVGDQPFEGWLGPLSKAIYPVRSNWRRARPAAGCPAFGEATVVERPLEFDRQEECSVRPGLITPEHGTHEVVWWDPSKLKLDIPGDFGTAKEEMLKHDAGSLASYRSWQQDRAALLARGARPRFDVFTASLAHGPPPEATAPVGFASAERSAASRPGGRRFGTLVHAVMRDVSLGADSQEIARLAALNARIFGAPDEEIVAAQIAVAAAIAHPLLNRARTAARRHREYPIVLRLDDGRLLDGVIDLAFVEKGEWVVVDFKTDADSSARREQYERQLQWYGYALSKLTGMPAQAWLLAL